MRSFVKTAAALALALVMSPVLVAQWPAFPTRGVPRTADGAPDLAAPVPRTADGMPDLSGIWDYAGVLGFRDKPSYPPAGSPPLATFWNIELNVEGGLPLHPWAAELRKRRMADNSKDNPDAWCLPLGIMQLHTHSQPKKIVQTPDLIVILNEANAGVRQIFLDGRPAPDNDPQPWWFGYSRGRWEGDTLVVETTNLRDDGWLDVDGAPLTAAARVTERFRRLNFGNLQIDVTIDDPKAYTRPWTVRVNQEILLDTDLIEFVCQENERFTSRLGRQDGPR
jgi:hypothetical protein